MGGGDAFGPWTLLSQPAQSSSQQSTQSSSSSQVSQASSKSVDLAELNHLRLLVQYEFDDAPATTDELIEALGACHNNTHEAYHYLRSKRRLQAVNSSVRQTASSSSSSCSTSSHSNSSNGAMATAPAPTSNKRRQDDSNDGDAVSGVENPSKRMREGASPSPPQQQPDPPAPRSLRLRSSQDADMASQDTVPSGTTAPPNTQQQQPSGEPEAQIVCSQRKLSHDHDLGLPSSNELADMTMAPSQESEASAAATAVDGHSPLAAADVTRARQLLRDAIREQHTDPSASDDAGWISRIWDALMVSVNIDVAQQLDQTCSALATWLDDVNTKDFVAAQESLALDLVLEVLTMLPRNDDTGDLLQRVRPEQQPHELESEAAVVALERTLQHPDPSLKAHARSVAAETAIERLTSACSACIDRMVWFADARQANATHQRDVRAHIAELQSRLATMVAKCSDEVRAAESAVAEARDAKDTRSQQLLALVRARRDELLASGETKASAKFQAFSDVFHSCDADVAALRTACSAGSQSIAQCIASLVTCRHELAFAESVARLFAKVRDRREWFLENARKGFEDARAASTDHAAAALLRIVPVLTLALQLYYEFHSICQARANDEASEQRKALDAHLEYFGDSAPIKKELIEQSIREFVGVISRSTQRMLQIAETQSRVWRTHKDVLPRSVRRALVIEFSRLWQHLSGTVRDVLQAFVAQMQTDTAGATAGAATSEPAAAPQTQRSTPAPVVAAPARLVSTPSLPPAAGDRPNDIAPLARSAPASQAPSATSAVRTFTGSSVAKTLVAPAQASPARAESISMTQEIDSFLLRHAEPVSALFTRVSGDDTAPRVASASQRASQRASAVVPSMYAEPVAAGAPATPPDEPAYPVGAVVYTKFDVGDGVAQYSRGRVDKLLDDGTYSIVYDDGDVYTLPRECLFTQEHMEQDRKLQERKHSARDVQDSSSSAQEASDSTCAIM